MDGGHCLVARIDDEYWNAIRRSNREQQAGTACDNRIRIASEARGFRHHDLIGMDLAESDQRSFLVRPPGRQPRPKTMLYPRD
jgi:hypothetical protein